MLLSLVVLIVSVILHEVAHGLIAERLGDPTARLAGRLTLNPLPHIDLFGSILVPFFLIISGSPVLFGWAKPVPVDPYNMRNPRRDLALVSLAGPGTNLLIAILCSTLLYLFTFLHFAPSGIIGSLLTTFVVVNVILGIFNFVPIAPLDGFKIVGGILPESQAREWYGLERYGIIFLIIFLFIPIGGSNMFSLVVGPAADWLLRILLPASLHSGLM